MSTQVKFTQGYFRAALDGDELVMEPYCACGEPLEQDYHCTACDREVRCLEFRCADGAVLTRVLQLMQTNGSFKSFKAVIEEPAQ
jgi:hypothetical protein